MDYYYALLDNYKLLRQRKFKLSLREEEDEDSEAKAKARIAADAAFAGAKEVQASEREDLSNGEELVFTKIVSGKNEGKVGGIGGPFKNPQMKAVSNLDELDNNSLDKIIGYFMEKGGQDNDSNNNTQDNNSNDTDTPEQIQIKANEEELKNLNIEVNKLEEDGVLTREQAVSMIGQLTGGKLGTFLGGEYDVSKQMATMSEGKPPKAIGESIEATKELVAIATKLSTSKGREDLTNKDLEKIVEIVSVTQNGVMMGGFYRKYARKINPDRDGWFALVEKVNKEIVKRNLELPDKKKLSKFKVTKDSTLLGRSNALRGPLAEKLENVAILLHEFSLIDDTKSNEAKAIKERIKGELATALDPLRGRDEISAAEAALKMFDSGRRTLLGQIFADEEDMENARDIDGVKEVLKKEGYSEEQIEELIDLGTTRPGAGIALLLVASKRFSNNLYKDNWPDSVKAVGQDDYTDLGDKADIIATFKAGENSDETCKALTKEWNDKISEKNKEFYKGGCGGKDIGEGALVTKDKNGDCTISMEIKVVDRKNANISYGEANNSRYADICADGGASQNDNTKAFLKLNQERLEACGGKKAGNRIKESACDIQNLINTETSSLDQILTPGSEIEVPGAAEKFLDRWADLKKEYKNSGELSSSQKKRLEGAKMALEGGCNNYSDNNYDAGTPEAIKKCNHHLSAIKDELNISKMSEIIEGKYIEQTADGKNKVTGKALDYLIHRITVTGGSSKECVRVGRMLGVEEQTVGFNNAEIYSTAKGLMEEGSLEIIKKGNTYTIRSKESPHEVRFKLSMERGKARLKSQKEVASIVPGNYKKTTNNKDKDQGGKREDSGLLVKYLKDQQKLLEDLINRTK